MVEQSWSLLLPRQSFFLCGGKRNHILFTSFTRIRPQMATPLSLISLVTFLFIALIIERTTADTPIWSDEFNYEGPPDPRFWSYDLGANGWGNSELQNYTSSTNNVVVTNGYLVITARKNSVGNGFTSARIKTLNKVTFKYGRIEARIKIPNLANGLWPAFWTLGNNIPVVGWPACGELDIMEMGEAEGISAGTVNRRLQSVAHWYSSGPRPSSAGKSITLASDLTDGFHNFTMNWNPFIVSTYVDDRKIFEMNITDSACPNCTAFHKHHFILLNMAVGGKLPKIFTSGGITAPLPAQYLFDYVRIYRNEWTEIDIWAMRSIAWSYPPPPLYNSSECLARNGNCTAHDQCCSGKCLFKIHRCQ